MIHYGKTPEGDLMIEVSAENVGEVFGLLDSAQLQQRRTFNGLKEYIKNNFKEEVERYHRTMTVQRPRNID